MARIAIVNSDVKALKFRNITLSGTVTVDEVAASRKIIVYKNNDYDTLVGETTSDESGNFSVDVIGGTNDFFRIICIGEEGENSQIYEHVME